MKSQLDKVQELLNEAHSIFHESAHPGDAFDKLIDAIREATPDPFADARLMMAMEFRDKSPNSVYNTYLASIAMLIHDDEELDLGDANLDIEWCNRLAAKIMARIFES